MKWENSKAFYHTVSLTSLTSNDLWKPNLKISGLRKIIRNARSISPKHSNQIKYNIMTGKFEQNFEMLIQLSCPEMDFSNFPYDSHICPLLFYDEIVNGNGSKLNVEYLWYLHQNESRQKHGIPFLVSTWVVQKF